MNANKIIHSFQFGELINDTPVGGPFKKGFRFTLHNNVLAMWKAGKDIPVSDSYVTIMVEARNVRAFILEHVEVQHDIAMN